MTPAPITIERPYKIPPAAPSAPPFIPNPSNLIIQQKHHQMKGAQRYALGTACDPATKEPILTAKQLRAQLKTISISAPIHGDNVLIPSLAGVKQIFEMFIWNPTKQTLRFFQGNGVPWFQMTDFPDAGGLLLGFDGSFEQAHFEVDNNQALVMNTQNGTPVDGYIRYRVQNGSF